MILIDTQKGEFSKIKDISVFAKNEAVKGLNGNMLIIGLGGTGIKVTGKLKAMIADELTIDDNISFLAFDSDINEMQSTIDSSKDGNGLDEAEVISIYRPNVDELLNNGIQNNPVHPALAKWMSPDFPSVSIGTNGADGNRQIGRLMFSNAYDDVRHIIFDKLEDMYLRSGEEGFDVILITNVSGGTGSGILTDVVYNVRGYCKAKKYSNIRVGACLFTPDVLFANNSITDDKFKTQLLKANAYAALKEISYYMSISDTDDAYVFESTTHKIIIREDLFDACMLVSGREDNQGYISENTIYSDVTYYLYKLLSNKIVGNDTESSHCRLIRDAFFEKGEKKLFKIINETDYRIPIKEIENVCEQEAFTEAYKLMMDSPLDDKSFLSRVDADLMEIESFLKGKPGEPVELGVNGLLNIVGLGRPVYKEIKKGQDTFRRSIGRQLNDIKSNSETIIRSLKNKTRNTLDNIISDCMKSYGPFAVIKLIGAEGIYGCERDEGLIRKMYQLEEISKTYSSTGEFTRIVESIKDMAAKKLFAFPSAKKEIEVGYYDACIKESLTLERNILMDGIDSYDLFGDTVRWLRQMAEHYNDVYSQFSEDLKSAVDELADNAKKVIGYTLDTAKRHEFLPSDYTSDERINEFKRTLIELFIKNETAIDLGRDIAVKSELERIYKNLLTGVGAYAPEKLIYVAFAEERPTLQEVNALFVTSSNEKRDTVIMEAAASFVKGAKDKVSRKKICILKKGVKKTLKNNRFISIPDSMPHFSEAIRKVLVDDPYYERNKNIAMNVGAMEISVEDVLSDVPVSALLCSDELYEAYIHISEYKGLHISETDKNMKEFPELVITESDNEE